MFRKPPFVARNWCYYFNVCLKQPVQETTLGDTVEREHEERLD